MRRKSSSDNEEKLLDGGAASAERVVEVKIGFPEYGNPGSASVDAVPGVAVFDKRFPCEHFVAEPISAICTGLFNRWHDQLGPRVRVLGSNVGVSSKESR